MTTYSFKVTKGKFQLSLTTTDREMIVEEFEKWVRKISAYVSKNKGQEVSSRPNVQMNAEKEITQRRIDEQLKRTKTEMKKEESIPSIEETQKNLDVFYAPPKQNNEQNQSTNKEEANSQIGFDNILDKSRPVSIIVFKTSSREMMCSPLVARAYSAAPMAWVAAKALRSIQGIWTSPKTGSHVRPK